MKVIFTGKQPAAEGIETFFFNTNKMPRQQAGQFIELTLPHDDVDNRGPRRWFTLSNAPNEDQLAITTRLSHGGSTFKRTLSQLTPGTELHMAEPMGDFVLPKDPSTPLLFVAGGIGATPFRSIIRQLQLTEESRDIKLLYAASNPQLIAFKDVFSSLGDNFIVQTNRLDTQTILQNRQDSETRIYLSGPEPMVEVLDRDLKKSGVKSNLIQTDYFPGYPGEV